MKPGDQEKVIIVRSVLGIKSKNKILPHPIGFFYFVL